MPLLGTFGGASSQSFGTAGIQPGGSALYNSVSDSLSVPAGTAFQYGTGDFTIEMWFYPTSISPYGTTLFRQRGSNYYTQRYLFLWIHPNRQIFLQIAGNDYFVGTSNLCDLNAWNHVALVRQSGQMRIFLNGYANTARTNTLNYSDASVYNLMFGSLGFNTSYWFAGNITNIRVAKSSYYTSTFVPSRTPFTRTSQGATNVQLLLNFKNSAGLATDSSANSITVTNSNVTYSTLTPYTVPFVTPPVVNPVSAVVTPSTLTPGEGDTITFTVSGTNTTNGTYYYTVEDLSGAGAIATSDFASGSLSGSFTITGNSGSFSITLTDDLTTEGSETFLVSVRSSSISGTIIGSTDELAVTDSSLTPAFTAVPTSINEGSTGTFTVQNVGPNGTYYWTIQHAQTVNADFNSVSGSFTVSGSTGGLDNGTGTFYAGPVADRTTEGDEYFMLHVRSGSTSGPIILSTGWIPVIDTSITPSLTYNSTVNEGASLIFNAQSLGPAGNYYWTILHGTSSAADFVATSGTLTTVSLNGFTSWTVDPVWDGTTEAGETFQIEIRDGSTSGPVIVTGPVCTITNIDVTASGSPTSFNEGASTTITASATIFPAGTYYWTILNGTTTNADFTATSGSFSVASNTGSFTVTAATLGGAEAAETFQVQIRKDSTSGAVLATTGTLTINANAT